MSANIERIDYVRKIISDYVLDCVLVYSDMNFYKYDLLFNGIKCVSPFHYFYIDQNASYYIEIQYMSKLLSEAYDGDIVTIPDEDYISDYLKNLLIGKRKIGIIGKAPISHFLKLDKNVDLIDIEPEILDLVSIKTDAEIEKIKKAANILNQIVELFYDLVKPGVILSEIAKTIRNEIHNLADKTAFDISLVSMPYIKYSTIGTPSKIKVKDKDIVLIDFGLVLDGFYTDCTRMKFINYPEAEENWNKLQMVHHKVIDSLSLQTTFGDILNTYTDVMKSVGLPADTLEIEALGHGIGFDLHEEPMFYRDKYQNTSLKNNMVFTLEPEIVFEDYRMRIEDMILMRNNEAEILTTN